MIAQRFELALDDELLVGDTLGPAQQLQALLLHGAGHSQRQRQRLLREDLAHAGFGSAALDFSGHGESSGNSPASLQKRYQQAQAVLQQLDPEQRIHTLIGTSMSGEIAIRLACAPASRIT